MHYLNQYCYKCTNYTDSYSTFYIMNTYEFSLLNFIFIDAIYHIVSTPMCAIRNSHIQQFEMC